MVGFSHDDGYRVYPVCLGRASIGVERGVLLDSRPIMSHPPHIQNRHCPAVALVIAYVCLSGCTPTKEIPPTETKTVSLYGQTLDESASPQQVVFALLRSLNDDVRAAQEHKHDEQKAAFARTFSLAAFHEIEKRLISVRQSLGQNTTLGGDREEKIYNVVHYWAPIVGHYIDSFDTEFAAAAAKMRSVVTGDGQIAHVYYPVVHDPRQTDPAKQQRATIHVELVREPAGATSYWRVARVDFAGKDETERYFPASGTPAMTQPAIGLPAS